MSGLEAYTAKQKVDWRGWQWNRIVERLSVPVEDATVLYLCGPDDVDRQKAVDRGFRSENLIAVDLDEANVQAVRDAGGVGIADDLHSVVGSWPDDWPIDVVVADYCAGIHAHLQHLEVALFARPALHRAAVAVNLMRGRDSYSTAVRTEHFSALDNGQSGRDFNPGKHRGFHFLTALPPSFVYQVEGEGVDPALPVAWIEQDLPLTVAASSGQWYRFERPRAAFHSYTSTKRTYFDSVVFAWVSPVSTRKVTRVDVDSCHWENPSTKRKIAACRAVRTKRLAAA